MYHRALPLAWLKAQPYIRVEYHHRGKCAGLSQALRSSSLDSGALDCHRVSPDSEGGAGAEILQQLSPAPPPTLLGGQICAPAGDFWPSERAPLGIGGCGQRREESHVGDSSPSQAHLHMCAPHYSETLRSINSTRPRDTRGRLTYARAIGSLQGGVDSPYVHYKATENL